MAGWFDSNSGLSLVHVCPTCNEITYDEKCCCEDYTKHNEIDVMRQTNDFLDCLMRSVECTVWTATACCAIVFERRFDTGEITHVIMAEAETKQFVSTNKPVLVSKVFVGDDRLVYSL